jgi:hypothetical protein
MIRPVVDAMLAKVPGDIRDGVKTIVTGMSDADAVEFMKTGWGVTADQAEIMRGLKAQRAAVAHGHAGGVKTARKRRMGLIPAADPAGAKWKPDYRSPLNRAVFPTWGKIPNYIPSLVPFMSPAVAKTVIIIGAVVDHRGDFELPRAQHAEAIGLGARKAYAALETLRDAGVIQVKFRGDRNQATIWSYVPVVGFDTVKARKVLQAKRKAATEDVTARLGA